MYFPLVSPPLSPVFNAPGTFEGSGTLKADWGRIWAEAGSVQGRPTREKFPAFPAWWDRPDRG